MDHARAALGRPFSWEIGFGDEIKVVEGCSGLDSRHHVHGKVQLGFRGGEEFLFDQIQAEFDEIVVKPVADEG